MPGGRRFPTQITVGKSPVSSRHPLQFAHFCCSPLPFFFLNVSLETSEQQTPDPNMSLKVMASIPAWFSSLPGGAPCRSSSSLQIKRQRCRGVTWSGDQWHGHGNESRDGRGRPHGFRLCSLGGGWALRGVLSEEASVTQRTPRRPFTERLRTLAQSKHFASGWAAATKALAFSADHVSHCQLSGHYSPSDLCPLTLSLKIK